MSAIRRRLTNVERHLASGSGTGFPDPELVRHWSERQAAAERDDPDPSFPRIEPGERWPAYLARCAAHGDVTVAELQAEFSTWEEEERAIMALERYAGPAIDAPRT